MKYGTLIPCFCKLPETIYPDEIFIDVSSTEIPFGFNHYKVSNYGRIYDYRSHAMCNKHIDSKGYEYIISSYNGEKRLYRVHRLVLASFAYIYGCELMLVNHIDGIKTNNCLYNLEWTDYSGNIIHAYKTGLINNKQGEDRINSVIDNNTARIICERLQNGDNQTDIANDLGIDRNIVYNINTRRAWNFISKDYVFKEKTNRFNDDQVNSICEYFENNPFLGNMYKKDYLQNVLESCGIDSDKKSIDIAATIYNKKAYKNISKNYNFG